MMKKPLAKIATLRLLLFAALGCASARGQSQPQNPSTQDPAEVQRARQKFVKERAEKKFYRKKYPALFGNGVPTISRTARSRRSGRMAFASFSPA